MSGLGWSYPAGCSSPPDDNNLPCGICGMLAGWCDCPECPVCGTAGDPACELNHGLVIPQYQKDLGEKYRREQKQLVQWEHLQTEHEYRESVADVTAVCGMEIECNQPTPQQRAIVKGTENV